MPADTFSSFLGMTLQSTGNNNNAWGTILNGSALQTIEKAIAGNVVHAVTGGTLDLSGSPPPAAQTQALEMIQSFSGTLTANQVVKLPNVSKVWLVNNSTTGAFQLLMQTASGAQVNIPQGTFKWVWCDGSNSILRMDREQVGEFVYAAVQNAGTINCAGQSLLKTDYPDLFSKIGTTFGTADSVHFTLPLLTDTGRFLRSTSGSLTLGTYQANQNKAHTHTGSGTSSGISVAHTHTGSGTTSGFSADHTHFMFGGGQALVGAGTASFQGGGANNTPTSGFIVGPSTGTSSANHTHTFSFTTSTDSVDHSHTYSFTTSGGSADGAEARPESLAVVISIRY